MKQVAIVLILLIWSMTGNAWEIDLSRRNKEVRHDQLKRAPASEIQPPGFFEKLVDVSDPSQEIVILNTPRGFLPRTIRLKKDLKYKVHVVNVNEDEKNVSFILTSFSEYHATYYGKIKSFNIMPKKEGVYSFQCPETSAEGRVVVYGPPTEIPIRQPAGKDFYGRD